MSTQPQTRISKAEAAERPGCSEKTIDRLRAAGELVAVKSSNSQQAHVQITVDSPSKNQLAQVASELKKLAGKQKAVGGGVYMRLDKEGNRRFQYRLKAMKPRHRSDCIPS